MPVVPRRSANLLEKILASLCLVALACAAACHAVPQPAPQTTQQTLSIRAYAQVQPPPTRRPYRLLAYSPYTAEDVAALEVSLWDGPPPTEGGLALQTLSNLEPTAPIYISNLKRQRDYWVRVKAFNASAERIDSQDDACVTQFDTGDEDFEASLAFKCRLADRTFTGLASGTIAVEGEPETIATLTVKLLADAAELDQLELTSAVLDEVITLSNLKRDVIYTVRLSAVDSSDSTISDCAEEPACEATFTLDTSGPMPPLVFPLKLTP